MDDVQGLSLPEVKESPHQGRLRPAQAPVSNESLVPSLRTQYGLTGDPLSLT